MKMSDRLINLIFFLIHSKETPVSSTQSSVTPLSSSIAASTANSGSISTSSSSISPPFSSVSSFSVNHHQNSQLYNSQPHNSPKDEIYIDDEGLEGSGGRGEVSFNINFMKYNLLTLCVIPHIKNSTLFEI